MDRPGTRNSGSKGEGRVLNQFSQPFPLRTPPLHNCVLVEWRASISTVLNKTRTVTQEEIFKDTLRLSGVPRHTAVTFLTAVQEPHLVCSLLFGRALDQCSKDADRFRWQTPQRSMPKFGCRRRTTWFTTRVDGNVFLAFIHRTKMLIIIPVLFSQWNCLSRVLNIANTYVPLIDFYYMVLSGTRTVGQ